MLQGLDTVDWQNLKHNFGTAENLLGLLRQMLSDDAKTRRKAFDGLLECICHQGTTVEATAPVIPFLIQMLAMEGFQNKAGILVFFVIDLIPCDYWKYYDPPEWTPWDADIRQEVAKGLPVYLSLLDDPDQSIRIWAITVLFSTWFPEDHASTIANALRQCIAVEVDEGVKAMAVIGLGALVAGYRQLLAGRIAEDIQLFQHLWQSEQGSLRYVAGSSLTRLLEDQSPEDVIQRLVLGMARPELSERPSGIVLPKFLVEGTIITEETDAIVALSHLSLERRLRAYTDALNLTDTAEQARLIAGTLLENIFNGSRGMISTTGHTAKAKDGTPIVEYQAARQERSLDTLTNEQKQAIRLVLEADKVWEIPNNLLERFGIFGSRRKLLARLKKEGLL